jgi:hypothetical protein
VERIRKRFRKPFRDVGALQRRVELLVDRHAVDRQRRAVDRLEHVRLDDWAQAGGFTVSNDAPQKLRRRR